MVSNDEQCRFCECYTCTGTECGMCSKTQELVDARYRCKEYKYKQLQTITINAAELLRNAIVQRAVKDLKLSPKLQTYDARQSVHFFRSDYFKSLCSIDGENIIKHICEPQIKKVVKKQKVDRRRSIEYKGRRMKLKEWSAELGISYNTLVWRLNHGWTTEKAFTEGIGENE